MACVGESMGMRSNMHSKRINSRRNSRRNPEKRKGLRKDESAQVLILFSLIVATLIASLAILHAQNLIAGVESSRAFLSFPKDEIRNLKNIARFDFQHLDENGEEKLIDQLKLLYASKGTYVDFEAISSNYYKLVYSNSEVYFTESLYVEDEDIWLPSGGGRGGS